MDSPQVKQDTNSNKRLYVLSRYLELSIRAGAYASNLFFGVIIYYPIENSIHISFLRSAMVWGYGLILYEVIWRVVSKKYRPKFIKKSDIKDGVQPNQLILNDDDFEYRTRVEKNILQLSYYYSFQLILSLIFVLFFAELLKSGSGMALGFAIWGGFSQLFNFFGIAIISAAITNNLSKTEKTSLIIVGNLFALQQIAFVAFSIFKFYFV